MVDLTVSASSDPALSVYVSRIINFPDQIELELSAYDTSLVIGVFNIPVLSHSRYDVYVMAPGTSYAAAAGRLVVGEVTSMQSRPYGTFIFAPDATQLEARVVVPGLASISRFVFKNADGTSFSVSGDVTLIAQNNTRFRLLDATTVAIDAGENLGLNAACADTRPCLKTINNVAPDDEGNFWITTSDCAKLTPLTTATLKGLNLSDTCCKPCLSCNEIGDLTERLMQLETDLLALRDHYNQVSLLTAQYGNLVTASCECS